MIETFDTLVRALPLPCPPERRKLRLAVLTAGGPAPGMNTAEVRSSETAPPLIMDMAWNGW